VIQLPTVYEIEMSMKIRFAQTRKRMVRLVKNLVQPPALKIPALALPDSEALARSLNQVGRDVTRRARAIVYSLMF
jgi:hypothetical protein